MAEVEKGVSKIPQLPDVLQAEEVGRGLGSLNVSN